MNERNPTLTTADSQAIEEFCRYKLVTITQLDTQRVKATFPDSSDNEESVIGSSVVSMLLEVARRQKVSAYLRGARAMEQQIMEGLHNLPGALTIIKGEQGYTWQVFTRTGTAFTLVDALVRGLEAIIEQGGYKAAEEQQQ
jgi:hypothetical protein